ncbi:MAG: hypothetical protein QM490_01535 [Candidatus Gracilibacteria bacterium]
MKIYLFIFVLVVNLNAYILFLGNSNDKFKCDNQEYSPTKMLKCSKVIAVTNITFCYFKNRNLGCRKLFKNDELFMNNIDNNSLSFKRLLSFNEVKQTTFGIKRFSDIKNENNLIPNGTILKPKRNFIIYIMSKDQNATYLLLSNKKIIFKTKIINNRIKIPKSMLNYNTEYTWIIKNNKKQFSGSFDILDRESEKELFQELRKNTENINNKKILKQIKSIIFDQYGLKYDRYKLLKGGLNEKDSD